MYRAINQNSSVTLTAAADWLMRDWRAVMASGRNQCLVSIRRRHMWLMQQ